MSGRERRRYGKDEKRLCRGCRQRRARYWSRAGVRADRDHTLCFECFRRQRDRVRALERWHWQALGIWIR